MDDYADKNFRFHKQETIAILAITCLAFVLRIYQLGSDGFWFDELGVAIAIRSPDWITLLDSVRAHVMAMPLDYVVGWVFTRACQSEACLRLPAALWGVATIPVAYLFFRHLVEKKTALLGALLLAVSPFHIQYSQELRFYAPLSFFYILSTLLLILAIHRPELQRWLFFILACVIGSYFHLYVFLSFINGGIWIFLSKQKYFANKKIIYGFLVSFLAAIIIILPGWLFFRSTSSYDLFHFDEALINLMIGFGWLPTILFPIQTGMVWYPFFLFFQVIGSWSFFKSKNRIMLLWIFSSLLQVGFIFLSNMITGYAFRGRQLVMLMPLFCLLAGQGIVIMYSAGYQLAGGRNRDQILRSGIIQKIRKPIFISCMALIGISVTYFSLQTYYSQEKSRRKELSLAIARYWASGDVIYTTPAWEGKFYAYYLNLLGYPEIEKSIVGVDYIDVENHHDLPVCWITDISISTDNRSTLQNIGYKIVPIQGEAVPDTQILWCR